MSLRSYFVKQEDERLRALFHPIRQAITQKFQYDLSHMRLELTDRCIFNTGLPDTSRNPAECGGAWTTESLIYIGTCAHLERVLRHYTRRKDPIQETEILQFGRYLMAHELGHELYRKQFTQKDKDQYRRLLRKFDTEYSKTVKPEHRDEERFCEYVAIQVTAIPVN